MIATREERVQNLGDRMILDVGRRVDGTIVVSPSAATTWLLGCIVDLKELVDELTDLNDERYDELLRERDRLADRIAELGEEQEDLDAE